MQAKHAVATPAFSIGEPNPRTLSPYPLTTPKLASRNRLVEALLPDFERSHPYRHSVDDKHREEVVEPSPDSMVVVGEVVDDMAEAVGAGTRDKRWPLPVADDGWVIDFA